MEMNPHLPHDLLHGVSTKKPAIFGGGLFLASQRSARRLP